MFGFGRRAAARQETIGRLHGAVVAASRAPSLFGEAALPDSVEGRFESLVLHALVVLRRLRALPPPAEDVAQDLVDSLFAHLEVALRESGIGDMGVPKRMKKLARAFYDRTLKYEAALSAGDRAALAAEAASRLSRPPERTEALANHLFAAEARLGTLDLDGLLDSDALARALAGSPA